MRKRNRIVIRGLVIGVVLGAALPVANYFVQLIDFVLAGLASWVLIFFTLPGIFVAEFANLRLAFFTVLVINSAIYGIIGAGVGFVVTVARRPASVGCQDCGYDLSGTCPECGAKIDP